MAEPLPEPPRPTTTSEPVETTPEIARRNVLLGLGLFALSLLIAAGAVVISLIYLHYD